VFCVLCFVVLEAFRLIKFFSVGVVYPETLSFCFHSFRFPFSFFFFFGFQIIKDVLENDPIRIVKAKRAAQTVVKVGVIVISPALYIAARTAPTKEKFVVVVVPSKMKY